MGLIHTLYRRSKWFPADIDLSFISDPWRRLVIAREGNTEVLVRQHLEICIFSYLAMELKTGDACVMGSENYADFREQLLSWEECEPQIEEYCRQLGSVAKTGDALVKVLKAEYRLTGLPGRLMR